ncbi:serine hydrolase [Sphingomonas sp.]|uniref:serine hydrolase n=1 Tax=Sphingomonas sp. TaxID=28214 RepID=UPI0025FD8A79|nr:serine hydrolase [Sphingomonas sp.]
MASPLAAAPPADIENYVTSTLTNFGVPGAAVAIVEPGGSAALGFGVRKLAGTMRVDEHTLFPIGSNTKAFTVAGLAILIDRGKLSWDDRIEDVLPGFKLYDAYASRELTVRDLLTHRSGLGKGQGDLLIFPETSYSRKEIVDRLRFLPPKTSFRSVFAYDNVLYIAAGVLLERVSGQRWEDFTRKEIFEPLGMRDATPSFGEIRTGNRAWPHARTSGLVRGLGPVGALPSVPNIDNEAPAGSINASATDMTKWMSVQLRHGEIIPDGKRLFSETRAREMWAPQVIVPTPPGEPELATSRPNLEAYGLGWTISDYRGHKIVTHGGGVYGGISMVVMIPDLGVGITVLTNAEEHYAVKAIAYHLLDHYLGASPVDWAAAGKIVRDRQLGLAEMAVRAAVKPDENVTPPLPLQTYAGVYRDAWYGTITVTRAANGLAMSFDRSTGMAGQLIHVDHDTFRTHWGDPAIENAYVTFAVGSDRRVKSARMKPVSPIADFSFDFSDLLLLPVSLSESARQSP